MGDAVEKKEVEKEELLPALLRGGAETRGDQGPL